MSDRAILLLQFKVKYIYCNKCSRRPIDFSQHKVDKFIREHAGHSSKFGEYLRVVGYIRKPSNLKNRKVSIQFLDLKMKDKTKKHKKRRK